MPGISSVCFSMRSDSTNSERVSSSSTYVTRCQKCSPNQERRTWVNARHEVDRLVVDVGAPLVLAGELQREFLGGRVADGHDIARVHRLRRARRP